MQHICLLRLSAIGDATHVLPVISTLKSTYPDAQLTWIIGRLEYKLMQGLDGVEFIVFDKSTGIKGLLALRSQLKKIKFDALLHMQLSFRANIIAGLVKAKRKIGFDKLRSKEMHSLFINERIKTQEKGHVLDSFMQFAEHLGANKPVYQWPFSVSKEDQAFADKHISKQPCVIISPSSSHALRNWNSQGYAQVADYLFQEYSAQVILCGGPSSSEKEMAQQIADLCTSPILNLTGQDTLKQLLCLMRKADLVISPDSGPLHMAGAVGTPVIGLHAASNHKRSGSYQYSDLVVDKYDLACQKIYQKSPHLLRWGIKTERPGMMELIEVSDVRDSIHLWYRSYYKQQH